MADVPSRKTERGVSVLLVAANAQQGTVIEKAFGRFNARTTVTAVATLQEARGYLTGHTPDLLIVDLALPEGRTMDHTERTRILIVDDVADNLDLLTSVFEDEPYEIATACDGKQALKLLQESPPDLAILDVQMPDIDGYELCRMIREDHGMLDMPIIFLTAERPGPENAAYGLELGACDYVSKPFNAAELKARVRTALRRRLEHRQAVHAARTITRRFMRS
ncbi:MAG: response regulator [Planctomycetes bacterium]|nr:response regulator [Planctomycetota bacterium]